MKYQFNEQELLSLFYNKEDDTRPHMTAPYLKNGYVCATESHILIRIKAETLNGEYSETEFLDIDWPTDNCNFIVSLQDIETMLSSIPKVVEEKQIGEDIWCMECDGEGEVEWAYQDMDGNDYSEYHDCPVCKGSGYKSVARYEITGRMIPDLKCLIQIRYVNISAKLLEILGKAMKIIGVDEIRCVYQYNIRPCVFRMDDNIEIMIMPCLGSPCYHIEGRGAE